MPSFPPRPSISSQPSTEVGVTVRPWVPWWRRPSDKSVLQATDQIATEEHVRSSSRRSSKRPCVTRAATNSVKRSSKTADKSVTLQPPEDAVGEEDPLARAPSSSASSSSSLDSELDSPEAEVAEGILDALSSKAYSPRPSATTTAQKDMHLVRIKLQLLAREFKEQRRLHQAAASATSPCASLQAQSTPLFQQHKFQVHRKSAVPVVAPEIPVAPWSARRLNSAGASIVSRPRMDVVAVGDSDLRLWLKEKESAVHDLKAVLERQVQELQVQVEKQQAVIQQLERERMEPSKYHMELERVRRELETVKLDYEKQVTREKELKQDLLQKQSTLIAKTSTYRDELVMVVRENNQLKSMLNAALNWQTSAEHGRCQEQLRQLASKVHDLEAENLKGKRLCRALVDELAVRVETSSSP